MPSKSTTPSVSEDALRTRAYLLWEADGGPFGRDEHYWGLAFAEASAAPAKPKRAAAANSAVPEKKAKPKAAAKPAKPKKK